MKGLAAAVCAGLAVLAISPVLAQTADEMLRKSARAVARITLIEPVCGPFYLLDRKKLAEVRGLLVQDGIDRFGVETLQRIIDRVRPEFLAAIKREGAAAWCPAQRAFYRYPGQSEFIGSPLD